MLVLLNSGRKISNLSSSKAHHEVQNQKYGVEYHTAIELISHLSLDQFLEGFEFSDLL